MTTDAPLSNSEGRFEAEKQAVMDAAPVWENVEVALDALIAKVEAATGARLSAIAPTPDDVAKARLSLVSWIQHEHASEMEAMDDEKFAAYMDGGHRAEHHDLIEADWRAYDALVRASAASAIAATGDTETNMRVLADALHISVQVAEERRAALAEMAPLLAAAQALSEHERTHNTSFAELVTLREAIKRAAAVSIAEGEGPGG